MRRNVRVSDVAAMQLERRRRAAEAPEHPEDITEKCTAVVTRDRSVVFLNVAGANVFLMERECHIRKIDGMHNGPAFIIERRKA
ncbi:MAG: hypothetical protein OEY86_00800 [Nitrospira sp.]|nr:hypothetical protein [Nitrospira sp.]